MGLRNNKGQFIALPMPNKEELEKMYLEGKLTPSEIGQKKNVSSNTVRRWLKTKLMMNFLKNRLKARKLKGNGAVISSESWSLIEQIRRLNK